MIPLPRPLTRARLIALALVASVKLLSLAALAVIALGASKVAHAAPEAEFDSAFQNFTAAANGDSARIDKAADAFEVLLRAEPVNPVLMAYAGASTTMKASTTMQPMKKMSYAEDGLALIDKSLALLTPAHEAIVQHGTPGVLEVKFVAANTFLAVPGFMNRGVRGAKLLNEVLASPLFTGAPLPFKGSVWMRAATLAIKDQRAADARGYLNQVIVQGAPQAEAARAKLKDIA